MEGQESSSAGLRIETVSESAGAGLDAPVSPASQWLGWRGSENVTAADEQSNR